MEIERDDAEEDWGINEDLGKYNRNFGWVNGAARLEPPQSF